MPIGNTLTASFDKPAARWLPVYEKLRDAIIDHRLKPGRKLPEDELASIYEVGRSVVRAALQALAHDGLARLEPNRGAFVARPTPREAREVFEARALIEPKVAEMAAQRADAAAIAALRSHLALEHRAMADGRQRDAILLSARFHVGIAEIANHKVLSEIVADLVSRSSLIVALYWQRRDATCESHAHEALVAALAAGEGRE
ncbi:MAG: GntR family transcriptional regulator, partial [Gammaproteobacteria bacterium]|nr:GntR family transcriptional regulator [Gammaproteobacteria bacterium]